VALIRRLAEGDDAMTVNEWVETHEITHYARSGYVHVVRLMLVGDNAYSCDEWHAGFASQYRKEPEGWWTYEGWRIACSVKELGHEKV
jgi:hypothetical protein